MFEGRRRLQADLGLFGEKSPKSTSWSRESSPEVLQQDGRMPDLLLGLKGAHHQPPVRRAGDCDVDAKRGRACPIGVGPSRGAQQDGMPAGMPGLLLRRYNGVLHALSRALLQQTITFCSSNRTVQKVIGMLLAVCGDDLLS